MYDPFFCLPKGTGGLRSKTSVSWFKIFDIPDIGEPGVFSMVAEIRCVEVGSYVGVSDLFLRKISRFWD